MTPLFLLRLRIEPDVMTGMTRMKNMITLVLTLKTARIAEVKRELARPWCF